MQEKKRKLCYYGDYLHLDKMLSAQQPESRHYGPEAHDETLFIITHQAYELWFKQILHEVKSIIDIFSEETVKDQYLTTVEHRLSRVTVIQNLLNQQIEVIETMTPQDFMEFRDFLVPASGFQSIQFKMMEISLGLKSEYRIDFDKESFYVRLNKPDQDFLRGFEERSSLFELVDEWLGRMPFLEFGDFKFWALYKEATDKMLEKDIAIVKSIENITEHDKAVQLKDIEATRQKYAALIDPDKYEKLREEGSFRMSRNGMLGALFINLYQHEPVFSLPFQILRRLMDIDELLTIWRYKHAVMVQRMLGSKIGTGGSSGHDYLKRTTEKNRIFTDLFHMATFMLPKNDLPKLPADLKRVLRFCEVD
ncbi:MAG: tryptophan 2,3-dioxygenase [Psychrosphaera sp.]|nr:tryptophan 2,3-dioxygenase [Psychrosphaera sp.]